MGFVHVFILSFLCFFNCVSIECTRLKILKNGYEDMLISLPANASPSDRPKLITSLKVILKQSSDLLFEGTKGRAFFRSVVFLIPSEWGGTDRWRPQGENITSFEDAPPVFNREGADVTVILGDDHPYVLHHQGCGYKAKGISLPTSFLLGKTKEKGKVFVNLWSEFRYGIFSEKGFDGDEKYPVSYKIPGDPVDRTTDCNLDFFRETNLGENSHNVHSSSPHEPTFIPREGLFCEGHLTLGRNHNPEAPSKHNLLCQEQGTWFVVRKSPDFALGRNAARINTDRLLSFRFVREIDTPKVLVAIEISARMGHEDRYAIVQNAFAHFVTTLLPDGSELSLVVFGGDTGVSVLTSALTLADEAAKITYLEAAPLPDETSGVESVCLDCVLDEIFKITSSSSPTEIVLVTAQSAIAASRRDDLRRVVERTSESRLHVFSFMDDHPDSSYPTSSVFDLCLETGTHFVSLRADPFGDLYRAFGDVVKGTSKKVMIHQEYLPVQDDEDLEISFTIDSGLSTDLKVTLSGPSFTNPLVFSSTTLSRPGDVKWPKKQELVPSWVFEIQTPEAGEYTLRTRRKFDEVKPILLSVTSSTSEESVTAKVWVEVLDFKRVPSPIQIFSEVKKGRYPVVNASVVAYIHHPESDGINEITLLDDGQGNVDVTESDGIYSYIYTNFTSTGFYNVYIKVVGNDNTKVLKGPSSPCCGSTFPYRDQSPTGQFQREAGPATFHVKTLPDGDHYPPSQVTDLRIFKTYDNDNIVVLKWTAVGDNYYSGIASRYEVKLFRDRFLLRDHFAGDPEVSVYSDVAPTTDAASPGATLLHQARLTSPRLARGPHYFAVRAVDAAGNAGPPSNAVPLWLERPERTINCDDDRDFDEL